MTNEELYTECFQYLDGLRESGTINMFGCPPYLADFMAEQEFHAFTDADRRGRRDLVTKIAKAWMKTFSDKPMADRVKEALSAEGV